MATQTALFDEPEHAPTRPTEHRYYVLDAADAQAFEQTSAALTLGAFHTLQSARAEFGGGAWLYDSLADLVYAPGDWPDTDEPQGVSLHLRALAEAAP